MVEIVWTEPALNQIQEIAEYIALDNQPAAKKLVRQLFESAERLSSFPESGRKIPELPAVSYREVISPPCRILYKHTAQQVIVIGVLRQERDFKRWLLSPGESSD
ncbi:MAG: type II toxin-antitoxin system RelE/ParE family toxin [Pseudomonadota bacterium]